MRSECAPPETFETRVLPASVEPPWGWNLMQAASLESNTQTSEELPKSEARVPELRSGLLGFVPLDPVRAVGGVLFLPDRHGLFEPVDAPLASRDRLRPVGARNRDHDRRIADLQLAGAVSHRHPRLRPLLGDLGADLAHLRGRHLGVRLVVELGYRMSA